MLDKETKKDIPKLSNDDSGNVVSDAVESPSLSDEFERRKRTKGYGRFIFDSSGDIIGVEYVAPEYVHSNDAEIQKHHTCR